jgi:hypothetical protein
MCSWKFLLSLSVVNWITWGQANSWAWGSWYVQNVSTFPNTFAIVSPLICVFWIQLTLFSAEPGVLFLCRNPTFRKNPGKYCKNLILPEDPRSQKRRRREAVRWAHHQGARPRPGRAHLWWGQLGRRLDPSFRLHISSDLKGAGGSVFFPDRLPLHHHHQEPQFGTRNSVLAPCRDRDLEEIYIIIITDVSPSTIHDFPIHVWVIPAVGEGGGRDWMRSFM